MDGNGHYAKHITPNELITRAKRAYYVNFYIKRKGICGISGYFLQKCNNGNILMMFICSMFRMNTINSTDIINYKKDGFDGEKYIRLQKEKILDRIANFSGGRLYLEIGGKFMYDAHAARVLPGFDPESKKEIFASLKNQAEILFCVNANDILSNRQLSNQNIDYKDYVYQMVRIIEKNT